MKMRFFALFCILFWGSLGLAVGNEGSTGKTAQEDLKADIKIIKVFEVLKLMDLVEHIDLVKDMDVLAEEKKDEKKE